MTGDGIMKTKTFQGAIELKADGDPGEFRAVFSTLNVVDKDGDVTLPGAFKDGQKVRISYWGHRWQDLPVGRGEIHANEDQAWVDGRFFLDTVAGKETYQTVKNLEELQEWSYGFDILEASYGQFEGQNVRFLRAMDVHEVSPVLLGAGENTRTERIKGAGREGGAGEAAGSGDGQADPQGQGTGTQGPGNGLPDGDGEPSGPRPQVLSTFIEIEMLED